MRLEKKINYLLCDYGKNVPDDRTFVTMFLPAMGGATQRKRGDGGKTEQQRKKTHQMHNFEATQLLNDTPTKHLIRIGQSKRWKLIHYSISFPYQ